MLRYSSDDSSAYRSLATVDNIKKSDSPLVRLRSYLENLSPPLWSNELEESTKASFKKQIMTEFNKAEREKKPPLKEMFGGVWDGEERPIREQRAELQRLVSTWGETATWKKELSKFDGGKEAFVKE